MKVLILSCNTGEGHNSCAKAIKEAYDSHGDICEIKDSLVFISNGFSKLLSVGHTVMYRYFPLLFKWGYSLAEKHPATFNEGAFIYKLLTRGSDKLYSCITDGEYDAVICTHLFSALLLTKVKQDYSLKVETAFVGTDYTCSPSAQDSCLDVYFIPDSFLKYDFESPNIPLEKMVESGITIRQSFYSHIDKNDAKRMFGIDVNNNHLVMMCGSMGCGPMNKLAAFLADKLPKNCELSIVCGTNEKLNKKLTKLYGNRGDIHILGFVKEMSALMDSADLYLTKPGGLSVTEAYVKNLPMVCIDAVAGCEDYNRRYFVRMGVAKSSANAKKVCDLCISLLDDNDTREGMVRTLKSKEKRNSAELIRSTLAKKED